MAVGTYSTQEINVGRNEFSDNFTYEYHGRLEQNIALFFHMYSELSYIFYKKILGIVERLRSLERWGIFPVKTTEDCKK